MTNTRVGHHCPACDKINEESDKSIAKIDVETHDHIIEIDNVDMNEDLQNLINKNRKKDS